MTLTRTLRGAAVLAAATGALTAQSLLPIGTSVGGGDDTIVGPLAIPFMFTFPDGTTTNMIDVSTNGFIFPAGASGASSATESVSSLLSQPSSIRAYWDDLNDTVGANDQIYLDTSVPNVATVTWFDTEEFGNGPDQFTVQAQLDASGAVTIVWDNRTVLPTIDGDCIVGLSEGNAVADPGEVDFSGIALSGSIVSAGNTVYESFGTGEFDLSDGVMTTGLVFTPTFPGYTVTGILPPPPAQVVAGRQACQASPFSFVVTPMGPGYVITRGGGTFDPSFAMGSVVSTADDAVVGGFALSFPFNFPDGSLAATIAVDTNGRVLTDTGESADFSPTVGELLGDDSSICPLWTDYNASDTDSVGDIWFHDDGTGTSASVTWDRIVQFGGDASSQNTFQVRLLSSGSIEFNYETVAINVGTATVRDVLIGVSAGNGAADPDGESDLTGASAASTDAVLYEFYEATGAETFPFPDLANNSVEIVASTVPAIGTNFDVDVIDSDGGAVAVVYFFGLPTGVLVASIPLGGIFPELAGCEVLTDIVTPGAVVAQPIGTPGTPTTIIAIPNDPALIGIEGLVVSGIVVNPTLDPALFPTDELVTTIGV